MQHKDNRVAVGGADSTEPAIQEDHGATIPRSELLSSLLVLLSAACWGTSGLFIKLIDAEAGVSPLALAFWRNLFTFAIVLVFVGILRPAWLRVRRSDLRWLIALGGCLGILNSVWILSVLFNGVTVAALQQSATPAMVTLAAWLIWREALTWSKIAAVALTIGGTVLVSGLDVLGQTLPSLEGLLAGLAVPVAYAVWNILGKKVRQRYSPFTTLTYSFGFAALVLLPFQFFVPQPWPLTSPVMLWFGALVALSTILPFSTYNFALGDLPASVVAILAMSEIVFASTYARLLLGERLNTMQLVGASMIIGGVLLLLWRRRREERQRKQSWRQNVASKTPNTP